MDKEQAFLDNLANIQSKQMILDQEPFLFYLISRIASNSKILVETLIEINELWK